MADTCSKGCGKKVTNRTGVCRECRKVRCYKCGTEFSPKMAAKALCEKCSKFKPAEKRDRRFMDLE